MAKTFPRPAWTEGVPDEVHARLVLQSFAGLRGREKGILLLMLLTDVPLEAMGKVYRVTGRRAAQLQDHALSQMRLNIERLRDPSNLDPMV